MGYTKILEDLEAQSHSPLGWKHGSFIKFVKDVSGMYPEFEINRISIKYMGSSSSLWDHV